MALVAQPGIGFTLTTILTLTAGALFVMWLGEQISERGIGNGMSLLIFAGIVVGFPQGLMETFQHVSIGERSILNLTLLAIFMVVVIAFVVLVERAQRRIPIQVASSQTGRRRARAQTTHLPLKVNMAGVMPVIFASAIIALPTAFASLLPDTRRCCTARSKSLTSLCRLQSHPAQYVSGIPSAAILLSISHPIRCSTRCLANVRARISGPMIAL